MKRKILYNLFGLLAALAICYGCYRTSGYRDIFYIVEGDYHFACRNKNLPLEDRYAARMGGMYTFFRYVRENTPENAVIYLPGTSDFTQDMWSQFFYSHHCANKIFATRFLYPRKVVTSNEYRKYGSFLPLTHVIVIGSGCKDMLSYEISDTTCAVFPIKKEI